MELRKRIEAAVAKQREIAAEVQVVERFNVARRISKVPGEAVKPRINVARAAGGLAQAGIGVGVVEVFAANLYCRGRRIVKGNRRGF